MTIFVDGPSRGNSTDTIKLGRLFTVNEHVETEKEIMKILTTGVWLMSSLTIARRFERMSFISAESCDDMYLLNNHCSPKCHDKFEIPNLKTSEEIYIFKLTVEKIFTCCLECCIDLKNKEEL